MSEKQQGAKARKALKIFLKKGFAGLFAALSGAVNSLFGGGGGMLVVPALRYGLDVEERKAHASAIAVMLPLSLFSAVAFTLRGAYDVKLGLWVGCGALIGGALGAIALKKLPKEVLSVLFYGVMIYAGIRFLK